MKPFLKWAGGKRWLVESDQFELPKFSGRYFEPFLGGGAVFFHVQPARAILSDSNARLIDTYLAIRDEWPNVYRMLKRFQNSHSSSFYYAERQRRRRVPYARAAQFIYLNRTCYNGLYRENLQGMFNVPIGTKDTVIFPDEDFAGISRLLARAEIVCADFEETMAKAGQGDFIFVDPPYTTAHNINGFLKYNQNIFKWEDQIRLRDAITAARGRGAQIILTNADHESVHSLYNHIGLYKQMRRSSVISGKAAYRRETTEAIYVFA